MSQADKIREQQRQTWDRFSEGWTRWDVLVSEMLEPVGREMISRFGSSLPDITSTLRREPGAGLSIAEPVPGSSLEIF